MLAVASADVRVGARDSDEVNMLAVEPDAVSTPAAGDDETGLDLSTVTVKVGDAGAVVEAGS